MKIVVRADGVAIEDGDVLTSLWVESHVDVDVLAAQLAGLGALDEAGAHVWLDAEALADLAEASTDAGWRGRFDAMVDFARGKGWTDGFGRVRAHISG